MPHLRHVLVDSSNVNEHKGAELIAHLCRTRVFNVTVTPPNLNTVLSTLTLHDLEQYCLREETDPVRMGVIRRLLAWGGRIPYHRQMGPAQPPTSRKPYSSELRYAVTLNHATVVKE